MSTELRELQLRITDANGNQFAEEIINDIKEEQEFIEGMGPKDKMPDEMNFRIRKRGQVYDYRKMSIAIMAQPAPEAGGMNRKKMLEIESLMEKLEQADGQSSVLLEEGEWKLLRDKVEKHNFPGYARGIRIYTDVVIEQAEKVAVGKVEQIAS